MKYIYKSILNNDIEDFYVFIGNELMKHDIKKIKRIKKRGKRKLLRAVRSYITTGECVVKMDKL